MEDFERVSIRDLIGKRVKDILIGDDGYVHVIFTSKKKIQFKTSANVYAENENKFSECV